MRSDGGLRKLFRKHLGDQVFFTSIESRLTQWGIPDLHGMAPDAPFWVECKRTRGWKVEFQPGQPMWLTRYWRLGGSCWVAVRRTVADDDSLYLVAGQHARRLASHGLQACPLAGRWQGGPSRWPWASVLALAARRAVIGQGKNLPPASRGRAARAYHRARG